MTHGLQRREAARRPGNCRARPGGDPARGAQSRGHSWPCKEAGRLGAGRGAVSRGLQIWCQEALLLASRFGFHREGGRVLDRWGQRRRWVAEGRDVKQSKTGGS